MLREEEVRRHPPGRGPDATSPHPGAVPPSLWTHGACVNPGGNSSERHVQEEWT